MNRALLASIRNLGACPCPRCEVRKDQIPQVGTIPDDVRRTNHRRANGPSLKMRISVSRAAIYERGKGIKSTAVEDLLSPLSYVPTLVSAPSPTQLLDGVLSFLHLSQNAFADRFGETFDLFSLFVVDLLHEIELGVWKAFFIHLIRILVSLGGNSIQLFNNRYVKVPIELV